MARKSSRKWVRHCLGLLILLLPGQLLAVDIADQTLRYHVNYRGHNAGELEVIIKKENDHYLVRTVSHLSMLARMFLQSYTIESRFESGPNGLSLISGREILNDTGEVTRSFTVDHSKGVVSFSGGDPVHFKPGTAVDADSFPLGLVAADATKLDGREFLSVSPKRANAYVNQIGQVAEVSVPAGNIPALAIDNIRPSEPDRVLTFWLRQDGLPVPAKIITGRKGKLTIMELTQ